MEKQTLDLNVKQCPFCGVLPQPYFITTQGQKYGNFMCLNCFACGPEVKTSYCTDEEWKDDAVNEWNKRHDK